MNSMVTFDRYSYPSFGKDPINVDHPHESRSDRYSFINTGDIMTTFIREGFVTSSIQYPKLRKQSKAGYQHHIVRMRPADSIQTYGDSEVPEVIIINSHDGTKAFRLGLGFFRFVCSNGLITGDFLADTGRILHKGNVQDNVLEYISNFSKNTSEKIRRITEMKTIHLSMDERMDFAAKACTLVNHNVKDPYEMLHINRYQDKDPSLWNTFNVVQENAIKGDFYIYGRNNKSRKARPVQNLTRNVEINTSLWNLAEEYIA